MYTYKVDHIPVGTPHNRRPRLNLNATTITIHNTANLRSSSANERSWLTNPSNSATASYHIVIDGSEAIECIPLNEVAWHAGDGSGVASGNRTSIGIEICESGNYQDNEENAVELVAKLLKDRKWGTEKLRRHYDWSGKICPRKMYDELAKTDRWVKWTAFVNRVQVKLNGVENVSYNTITKERIYAQSGVLKKYPVNTNAGVATDVRHIKFETGKVKYRFVYEKNAKVSDLVKKYKADYGFNAPFFYNGIPLGDSEDNDKVISAAYGKMLKWHEFAVVDGKPIIGQLNKSDKQDLLIQGTPLLVSNGKASYAYYAGVEETADDIANSRCQRTFIWIDAKGDLNLGIADGRTAWDRGLTLEEMSLYALSKGAIMALNFDGGGSTILADKNGGLNQSLNTGVNERIVHHAVLVYLNPEPEVVKPTPEEVKAIVSSVDLIDSSNGQKLELKGLLYESTTYVELRKIAEFLGCTVGWDAEERKATVTK